MLRAEIKLKPTSVRSQRRFILGAGLTGDSRVHSSSVTKVRLARKNTTNVLNLPAEAAWRERRQLVLGYIHKG